MKFIENTWNYKFQKKFVSTTKFDFSINFAYVEFLSNDLQKLKSHLYRIINNFPKKQLVKDILWKGIQHQIALKYWQTIEYL